MDLMTILALASAASGILGSISQGQSERERNKLATERANQQITWQNQQLDWTKDDLGREKESAVGSLLTQSAALGIGGPSVDAMKGYTIGEYNRAISRAETQTGWNNEMATWNKDDLDLANRQSYFNEAVGIGSSLLTMGTNLYSTSENNKYKRRYEELFEKGGLGL